MTDLQTIERDSNAQVVARIRDRDVTRGELLAAFNVVAPKPNWKAKINATVELDEFGVYLTQEAVIFFTGSPAHIDQVRPVGFATRGKAIYQVSAPGYYAVCGA